MFVSIGNSYWGFDVAKVEAVRNCVYVADLTVRNRDGGWSGHPVSVFWRETSPNPAYSNYFGLFRRPVPSGDGPEWGELVICGAGSVAEGFWNGARAANGEVVFSRWRHDRRTSADGSAVVDGGRDYFRRELLPGASPVRLRLVGPKFVVEEEIPADGHTDGEAPGG